MVYNFWNTFREHTIKGKTIVWKLLPLLILTHASVWRPKPSWNSSPSQQQRPVYLHDAGQLFHFILPRKQRAACVQLRHDAAQAPHVDGHVVRVAQDHLRGSIESALDVGVHCWGKGQDLVLERPLPFQTALEITRQLSMAHNLLVCLHLLSV